MPFEKDPNDIGALWIKSSAKGDYMTGTINGEKVVCFRNTRKTSDKHPDWRVLKSISKEEAAAKRPMHNANVPPPLTDDDLSF